MFHKKIKIMLLIFCCAIPIHCRTTVHAVAALGTITGSYFIASGVIGYLKVKVIQQELLIAQLQIQRFNSKETFDELSKNHTEQFREKLRLLLYAYQALLQQHGLASLSEEELYKLTPSLLLQRFKHLDTKYQKLLYKQLVKALTGKALLYGSFFLIAFSAH